MEKEMNIVKCPICGSVNLQACYDERENKKIGRGGFLFGVVGILISLLKVRNMSSTFWECQSCGHRFPME